MIGTQTIRNKILDLAIRGKLTEQLPEDGTAEELYQLVQEEKQVLIKEGKAKRQKPLPEIRDEEILFKIRKNWKMCRFGSIITLLSGIDYKPEEYNDEKRGTPYITGASNVLKEGVLINRWTEAPRCIANEGDILLICKGSGYGKIAICNVKEVHIARQIMAIKKTDLLNMRYILYFLSANYTYLKGKGQGLIPEIDRNSVLNMIFPLPPLNEQQRIVKKIEKAFSILDTIDSLQALYADNLTALKAKLIDAALQGKLTEQLREDGTAQELYRQIQVEKQKLINTSKIKKRVAQPEICEKEFPFAIPSNWRWTPLGELISIQSGRRLTVAEMKPGKIPVYGGNGITGYHDYGFVPEGTVVIGRVGYYCGSVHVTEQESWVTDNAFITTYPENCIDKWFLVYTLRHMKLGQSNNGSAQPVVSGKKVYPLEFPLPPLAEQKRIAAILKEMLPMCEG